MEAEQLISSLTAQTRQILQQVELLKEEDLETLTWRNNENSWNILECVEHLNLYGDFYLPEIESKIKNSKTKNDAEFRSGILGNYFAKSILPKEKLNKIKTFKDKDPLNAKLDKTTIDKFIAQQNKLLELIEKSKSVSLNKIRIPTTISSLIKIKLGDAFQFVINHILRHLTQIDRIKADLKGV